MKKIKTLHVIDRLDKRRGGSVYATLAVCKYLAEAGQPVEVAGSVAEGDHMDHLQSEFSAVKVHQFQRSFPRRYSNSAKFGTWLKENLRNYDLVEIHAIFNAFTWRAAWACRKMGVPYVVRPHGSLDPFDLKKHQMLKKVVGPLFIRPLLADARAILLTAPLEAERLVTYGAAPVKLVLPLPVALANFTGDGPRFRSRYGISPDAQVVLFMSRIDYKKGLDLLVATLAALKGEFPKLWFVLAGTGTQEYVALVRQWLQKSGVCKFTSEIGFVSNQEKADALAGSDLFALPSYNENFGIVNIEAMHAGLPVLVSDEVYIYPEIAAAGAGVVCQSNQESVMQHLRGLLALGPALRTMGAKGRDLVERRYRPLKATEMLVAQYTEILGGEAGKTGRP